MARRYKKIMSEKEALKFIRRKRKRATPKQLAHFFKKYHWDSKSKKYKLK